MLLPAEAQLCQVWGPTPTGQQAAVKRFMGIIWLTSPLSEEAVSGAFSQASRDTTASARALSFAS